MAQAGSWKLERLAADERSLSTPDSAKLASDQVAFAEPHNDVNHSAE